MPKIVSWCMYPALRRPLSCCLHLSLHSETRRDYTTFRMHCTCIHTYISTIAHARRDQSNEIFLFISSSSANRSASRILPSARLDSSVVEHRPENARRRLFFFPPAQLLLGWLSAVLLQCTVSPVYNDCEAIRKRT